MSSREKINSNLSTLLFVCYFVGYPLLTTLFLPFSSDIEGITRSITVPFRTFVLGLSILVIALNLKNKIKLNKNIYLLFLFWGIYLIRIVYDIYFRNDVFILPRFLEATKVYIPLIVLPAMITTIYSFKYIDFEKALNWMFLALSCIVLLSVFKNDTWLEASENLDEKIMGNVAMGSISIGRVALISLIVSLFILKQNHTKGKIFLSIIIIFLSLTILFRAGSRGPILWMLSVFLFWYFSRGKDVLIGIFNVSLILVLFSLFFDQIMNVLYTISPVTYQRFDALIYEGDSSGRDFIYSNAWNLFLDNPLFGAKYVTDHGGYAHNLFLDSFMGLGIIGGGIFTILFFCALKSTYTLIHHDAKNLWIGLLLIQNLAWNMTSGAFYMNQQLSVLLVLVFLEVDRLKNKNMVE